MSALQSITVKWKKCISEVYTVSTKGSDIEPEQVYYTRILELMINDRVEHYETAMLTEKEYFVEMLQGKK